MAGEDPGRRAGSHGGASLAPDPRHGWTDRDSTKSPTTEALPQRMLRIIHTADVHLGARHDDLGEQASAQRERQFAAFTAAMDLALAEKVDLFLIAGDLFDSNVQPKRSVERVAAQLQRLAASKIRTSSSRARTTATTARRSIAPTSPSRWPAVPPPTIS